MAASASGTVGAAGSVKPVVSEDEDDLSPHVDAVVESSDSEASSAAPSAPRVDTGAKPLPQTSSSPASSPQSSQASSSKKPSSRYIQRSDVPLSVLVRQIVHRFVVDHFSPSPALLPTPAPTSHPRPSKLRVLTMNMWALPIAPYLEERLEALCTFLGDWDVIALQEVYRRRNYIEIANAGHKAGLVHHHYFVQGIGFPFWWDVRGSGQMLLSRFPIVDVMYERYSVNGKPHKLHHADYLGGKGVGLARVDTGHGILDVYCTHMHARYTQGHVGDEYRAHRAAQAYQLAKFVDATRCRLPGTTSLLVGDMNYDSDAAEMKMIRTITGMKDAYVACHINTDSATDCTCDAPENSWREPGEPAERLDHVLFVHSDFDEHLLPKRWHLQNCSIQRDYLSIPAMPGQSVSVSDHFGVAATFELGPSGMCGALGLMMASEDGAFNAPTVGCRCNGAVVTPDTPGALLGSTGDLRRLASRGSLLSTYGSLRSMHNLTGLMGAVPGAGAGAGAAGVASGFMNTPPQLAVAADAAALRAQVMASPFSDAASTASTGSSGDGSSSGAVATSVYARRNRRLGPHHGEALTDRQVRQLSRRLDAVADILKTGVVDVLTRRWRHWARAVLAITLALFITIMNHTTFGQRLPSPGQWVLHVVRPVLVVWATVEMALAQFYLKEERSALNEVASQMQLHQRRLHDEQKGLTFWTEATADGGTAAERYHSGGGSTNTGSGSSSGGIR